MERTLFTLYRDRSMTVTVELDFLNWTFGFNADDSNKRHLHIWLPLLCIIIHIQVDGSF